MAISPFSTEQVISEAMTLPHDARALVAERLLASLEEDEPLSPAWRREVNRRTADLDAGRTKAIPLDEAFARVDEALRKVRP
jgi:putative addiction module component (TIGR02574 family)